MRRKCEGCARLVSSKRLNAIGLCPTCAVPLWARNASWQQGEIFSEPEVARAASGRPGEAPILPDPPF